MIKDGKQYIEHKGVKHQCLTAGYVNHIQHKWSFNIEGYDNPIYSGEKIKFLGTEFTVCLTVREFDKTNIVAWIV